MPARNKVPIVRMKVLPAAVALTGAMVFVWPSPAAAHTACANVPGGGGDGCVGQNHTWVDACDFSADGDGVRTHYYLRSNPDRRAGTVGDANGSASGCGTRQVTTTSNPVAKFTVCKGPNSLDIFCSLLLNA